MVSKLRFLRVSKHDHKYAKSLFKCLGFLSELFTAVPEGICLVMCVTIQYAILIIARVAEQGGQGGGTIAPPKMTNGTKLENHWHKIYLAYSPESHRNYIHTQQTIPQTPLVG